jgi:hypothetical protein
MPMELEPATKQDQAESHQGRGDVHSPQTVLWLEETVVTPNGLVLEKVVEL